MRTLTCPRCGATLSGNFKILDRLPLHYKAGRKGEAMKITALGTNNFCLSSWQEVPTRQIWTLEKPAL